MRHVRWEGFCICRFRDGLKPPSLVCVATAEPSEGGFSFMPGRRADPRDRFIEKFVVDGDCWRWTASINKVLGYGSFWDGLHKVAAHQFSYKEFVGSVPQGLEIDHLCRNRWCVNPAHLEAVTHQVNIRRGVGPPAVHARQTHCVRGHELPPRGLTNRICRICTRAGALAYWRQKHPDSQVRVLHLCSVPECFRNLKSHGLCGMHWNRMRRTGTTEKSLRP